MLILHGYWYNFVGDSMFNDIRIFFDNVQWKAKPNIKNGEIYYSIDLKYDWHVVDVVIDENIYENIIFLDNFPFQKIKSYKYRINYNDLLNKKLRFKVIVNYKYFIKAIYKYINNFIDLNGLLDSLDFFKDTLVGKQYSKDIDKLISNIENKSLDEIILNSEFEKDRIVSILLNSEVYLTLKKAMNGKDLMLLITSYIFAFNPINITQEGFNNMVKVAEDNEDAAENIWRLGMNYDGKGYNFDLLDEFFVNNKDIGYLGEYMTSMYEVNQERIVNLILKTNDEKYITGILKDEFIYSILDKKYIKILKDFVKWN